MFALRALTKVFTEGFRQTEFTVFIDFTFGLPTYFLLKHKILLLCLNTNEQIRLKLLKVALN